MQADPSSGSDSPSSTSAATSDWLTSGWLRGLPHIGMGAAIGMTIAFWVFGVDFFRGQDAYWNLVQGDAGSGLSALRYFLDEPWGFPLLEARGLNAPDGINIAFTDSLPVLALVAKVLRPLGIEANQWFALWYLAIYTLQGLFAVVAVRAFGVRSWAVEGGVAAIAVSAPIMMLRTWHPGLAGQFTLLAAWAIVGHLRHSDKQRLVRWLAVGLIVLSLFIHVYLVLGCSVIIGSALLGEVAIGRMSLRSALSWFGGLFTTVLVIAGLGGYFQAGASTVNGYYLWGVHLAGPIAPQWSRLWPGDEWILQANGSFEGFNWLGAGWVLLLFVVGVGVVVAALGSDADSRLATRANGLASVVRAYQVTLAALVVLGLYAVTPFVRIHGDNPHDLRTPLAWIFEDRTHHGLIYGVVIGAVSVAALVGILRQPKGLASFAGVAFFAVVSLFWSLSMLVSTRGIDLVTGQFRVAGRLFWPISYGLLVAGAVAVYRWGQRSTAGDGTARARVAAALIVLLAVVQVVDVAQFRTHAGSVLASPQERADRLAGIESLVGDFSSIHIEPGSLNCVAGVAGANGVQDFQDIGIVASWATRQTDAVYAARQAVIDCDVAPEFHEGNDTVTTVVVQAGLEGDVQAPAGFGCRELSGIVACSQAWG